MLKMGASKTIGTPVRCPSCRHPNLAIDIWCERCGTPLDWKPIQTRAVTPRRAPVISAPKPQPMATPREVTGPQYCWSCGAPNRAGDYFCGSCGRELGVPSPAAGSPRNRRRRQGFRWRFPELALPATALPQLRMPRWQAPQWRLPAVSMPRLQAPRVPPTVAVAGLVLAVLVLVPLVHLVSGAGRPAAAQRPPAAHLPTTNGTQAKAGSPQAIAIAAVQGKQVSPLVGHDATVHVPGNCANVHASASLQGGVVACLYDGTTIHVDGGPVYADGFLWWHTSKGWMAHDFLVAP
ncbi:MAG: zinc ribbon domain-containing protein [Chloroflexi bacterium]|nr:MAG: zinc ribbon domain-containing protein [Chloroflexota bacterium]